MEFNVDSFRLHYVEFSDVNDYPDDLINYQVEMAKIYISDYSIVYLSLMVAHLLYIRDLTKQGQHTMITQSANEGDVTISLFEPPSDGNYIYWMNVSPYGMQLLALYENQSAGGFYVGGMPENFPFRKVDGAF